MSNPAKDLGLFASLWSLIGTAAGVAQVRLEILGSEVELEKHRIFYGLILGALALFIFGVGIALLCGFILLLFWDGYRLAAAGTMAATFVTSGLLLLRSARSKLSAKSGMFSLSIAELARDVEALSGESQK